MLTFGTDGVRGRAHEDLRTDDVAALARAVGRVLGGERAIIGCDTRESGPAFVDALHRGFAAERFEVDALGVAPTPAVALLSARDGVVGVVVSASHNPYWDNGIKVFAPGGLKLTDEQQGHIQAELVALAGAPIAGAQTAANDASARVSEYVQFVVDSLRGRRLDGLRLVVDGANGAASEVAPVALEQLGCQVVPINVAPDGRNINDRCGSTDLGGLRDAVIGHGADLGLGFDGDADRVLAVDRSGDVVDGDQLIAICAVDRHERGELPADTVVVTVMSNLGFRLAMAGAGIDVVITAVGDRYVLEALEAGRYGLGGEQSGHVIFRDLATTGDGLLTAVQVLDVMARTGRSLAELAGVMTRLPQVLENLEVAAPAPDIAERVATAIDRAESELGETGRVLIRPSGTEPLVRVMVEAPTIEQAERVTDELLDAVRTEVAG